MALNQLKTKSRMINIYIYHRAKELLRKAAEFIRSAFCHKPIQYSQTSLHIRIQFPNRMHTSLDFAVHFEFKKSVYQNTYFMEKLYVKCMFYWWMHWKVCIFIFKKCAPKWISRHSYVCQNPDVVVLTNTDFKTYYVAVI